MKRDCFDSYHPIVSFLYFVVVIGCSMCLRHPVFLTISFVGAFAYDIYLRRGKAIRSLIWMIPVAIVSMVVNPLVNHKGETIVGYLPTGSAITLEAMLYGLASGILIVAVMKWFSCYQELMTSDKFIYLFGKIIPSLSLILTMVFRFVPRFTRQIHKISDGQKCIGKDVTDGTTIQRAQNGMKILSIMTTWALENSIDTSDSMRSRGYGLRGRTHFSCYRFGVRDVWTAFFILAVASGVVGMTLGGDVFYEFFPRCYGNRVTWQANILYVSYGALCLFPVAINCMEELRWHYLKSKI